LPTGRTGQAVAAAILGAAIGLAYLVIAIPLQDLYQERQAQLADRGLLASRLAAAATELPALRAQLPAMRAAASTSKVALEGANDALASADLQSHVEALATSLGVTLGSTEALSAVDRGPFRRIGLRFAVQSDYQNLVKLLSSIDASVPPLILDNLHIRSVSRPGVMGASAKLDATFEVYGIRGNEAAGGSQR
jgi:Tfp pilus assembly protein PilO